MTEADLHAYVDGRLDDERRRQVEAWLAADANAAARVADYLAIAERCRRAYQGVLDEPLPGPLRAALPDERPAGWSRLRATALVALLVVAAIAGWQVGRWPAFDSNARAMVHEAALAHAVYAEGRPHPLPGTAEREALLRRLSERLGMAVKPPDLGAAGFTFAGAEIVPGARAAALLLYTSADGRRVSLYWAPQFKQERDTGVRRGPGVGTAHAYYWVDDDCGYAVISSDLRANELLSVSLMAYAQLER